MTTPDVPAEREILAWHFVNRTLRDGRPVPADGVELRHDGPVEMCASGLHASVRAIDALQYAPGATACRVVMRDVVATDTDKLVARSRTILWRVDATDVLREFARGCALDALHMWATPETPSIDTVVEYLLTGDESLQDTVRAVAWGAWTAARDAQAARNAAGSAAWATWAVARDAVWAAQDAWDARDKWDTAWAVARDAWAVAGAARDAQSIRLERMLEAAR